MTNEQKAMIERNVGRESDVREFANYWLIEARRYRENGDKASEAVCFRNAETCYRAVKAVRA
jgi:hypothetical protein